MEKENFLRHFYFSEHQKSLHVQRLAPEKSLYYILHTIYYQEAAPLCNPQLWVFKSRENISITKKQKDKPQKNFKLWTIRSENQLDKNGQIESPLNLLGKS